METVIELADDFADDLSLQSASSESTTMPTKQPFVIGENLPIIVICFPFASLVIALVTIIMLFFFRGCWWNCIWENNCLQYDHLQAPRSTCCSCKSSNLLLPFNEL